MSNYEAKHHYQDQLIVRRYNLQFESSLQLWNLRAKLIGWGETSAFSQMIKRAPPGGNVLDIACGTGRYTAFLLENGYQVGGVDISLEMLKYAAVRTGENPNLLFLQGGDAENLPFDDGQFDGITCMRLFHRVPPRSRHYMLEEVKRVGRGWAILYFGMSTPWLKLRRMVREKIFPGRLSNPFPISWPELRRELQSIGFNIRGHRWVLPYVSEGMVVFVTW